MNVLSIIVSRSIIFKSIKKPFNLNRRNRLKYFIALLLAIGVFISGLVLAGHEIAPAQPVEATINNLPPAAAQGPGGDPGVFRFEPGYRLQASVRGGNTCKWGDKGGCDFPLLVEMTAPLVATSTQNQRWQWRRGRWIDSWNLASEPGAFRHLVPT